MIDRQKLADFARDARERVGLTDIEAARRTRSVSYQAIRKLERGAYDALSYYSSVEALAAVYDVDVNEFARLAGIIPDDITERLLEPGMFEAVRAWLATRDSVKRIVRTP